MNDTDFKQTGFSNATKGLAINSLLSHLCVCSVNIECGSLFSDVEESLHENLKNSTVPARMNHCMSIMCEYGDSQRKV